MTDTYNPGDRVLVCDGPDEVLHHTGTVLHAPDGYVVVAVDGYGGHIADPGDLEALPPLGVTEPAAWLRTAAKNLKRRPTNWGDGSTVLADDATAYRLLIKAAAACEPYRDVLSVIDKIHSVLTSVRAEDYEVICTLWSEVESIAADHANTYADLHEEAISGEAARSARDDDERGNA